MKLYLNVHKNTPVKRLFVTLLTCAAISGCAYYNYLYNARKNYELGEKQRRERMDKDQKEKISGGSSYDKCIESAGRMLEYYPNSRWEDDALLLLAKAYYRKAQYRSSIVKIDELNAKYPESNLVEEGMLWKGMSLMRVAQPDSGRMILSRLFTLETQVDLAAQAHFTLGEYYYDQDRWDPAQEQFLQVTRIIPKDEWLQGQAWVKVGDCLNRLERYEEALKLYNELLESKTPRRLKFQAKLEKAIILRKLEQNEEALAIFERLLKDAAFVDQFPKVELEASRSLQAMGRYDEARERLERLAEAEKKGEIAAQINLELGKLLWEFQRDLVGAASAFENAKKVERNSPASKAADSLLSEMVSLSTYWRRLLFIDAQIAALDSVQRGTAEIFARDTAYVDSVAILLKQASKSRTRSKSRDEDDAINRMVEKARKEQEEEEKERKEEQPDTTIAPLDSTAVADLLIERHQQRLRDRFDLASYHLFERHSRDSAKFYFNGLEDSRAEKGLIYKSIASLAYIASAEKDSVTRDLLYRVLLEADFSGDFGNLARRGLGLEVQEQTDTLSELFNRAESMWFDDGNILEARNLYMDIAEVADSSSDEMARALFSVAHLTERFLGEDSLAVTMYDRIVEQFRNTPFGQEARERSRDLNRVLNNEEETEPDPKEIDDILHPIPDYDSEFEERWMDSDPLNIDANEAKVYSPAEVDDPPEMETTTEMLKSFLSGNYPFQAYNEGITGTVELEFTLDPSGQKKDIEILSVDPEDMEFEEAAERVLMRIRYRPAWHRGKAVSVRLKQVLVFRPE